MYYPYAISYNLTGLKEVSNIALECFVRYDVVTLYSSPYREPKTQSDKTSVRDFKALLTRFADNLVVYIAIIEHFRDKVYQGRVRNIGIDQLRQEYVGVTVFTYYTKLFLLYYLANVKIKILVQLTEDVDRYIFLVEAFNNLVDVLVQIFLGASQQYRRSYSYYLIDRVIVESNTIRQRILIQQQTPSPSAITVLVNFCQIGRSLSVIARRDIFVLQRNYYYGLLYRSILYKLRISRIYNNKIYITLDIL